MQRSVFEVPFKKQILRGDIITGTGMGTPSVMFLHGAGNSNRLRFDPIRKFLYEHNVSSCAMDFIGHGETSGKLDSSSLKSRAEQAMTVISKLGLKSRCL